MTEFRIAHQLVANGRKKFLIPLLFEDLDRDELDSDLQLYIDTHTYTECKNLVSAFIFKFPEITRFDDLKLERTVEIVESGLTENEQINFAAEL